MFIKRWLGGLLAAAMLLTGAFPAAAAGGTETANRAAMQAYDKVVTSLIERVGVVLSEEMDEEGVAYAELVDFNKDGLQELFLFYFENGQHVEEVWSYIDSKARKIHSYKASLQGGLVGDLGVALATTSSGAAIIHTSNYSRGVSAPEGEVYEMSSSYTFYTMENRTMKEKETLFQIAREYEDGKETTSYSQEVKGSYKKLSAKAFDNKLGAYNYGKRKNILTSDAGYKMLYLHPSGNAKRLYDLVLKLRAGAHAASFKNVYSALPAADKSALTAFLYQFNASNPITYNKSYTNAQIAKFLVMSRFNHYIEFEPASKVEPITDSNGFMYYPYAKSTVDQWTQKLLGTTIPAKDYEWLKYKDGYYYMLDFEMGGDPLTYSPQVTALYELGKGIYYAEFVSFGFDWDYHDDFLDHKKYLKAMGTWSEADRNYGYSNLQYNIKGGYAILKQVGSGKNQSWQLLQFDQSGKLLTDSEILKFKLK